MCLASEWRFEKGDRKNSGKAKIDKSQKDTLCRLRKKADESIYHFVSGCSKLAQKEYKRSNNLGKIVHWKLEIVILKLEISGMNMSQKVIWRINIIKSCGISIFRLIML